MHSSRAELMSWVQEGDGGSAVEQEGSMLTATTFDAEVEARIDVNVSRSSSGDMGANAAWKRREMMRMLMFFCSVLWASESAC